MSEQAKFLEGSLFRHITVMALTASVGLMAVFLVDFVDMIFISMLGKAELAAAVGYAGAILFFTGSFGIGMAIACGAVVARALGQGDVSLARQRATSSLVIGGVLGAGFAALVWAYVPLLVALLGAEGETAGLATVYLRIILPSLPVFLLGVVGSAVLRAHGDGRRSMNVMIAAGVVNAALGPVLIFGLGLELVGAALASVAARLAMATLALRAVHRVHDGLSRPRLAALTEDLRPVTVIAVPAILTQLATPVGQAYVTRAMSEFGEDAVAGMAIVGRLTPVAFGVLFALSGAVGPIIGQNAGAGKDDRVRATFFEALLFAGIVTLLVSAALFLLREPLAWLFVLDEAPVAQSLVFLFAGPLSLLWFFNGVIFVSNAAFNNLGRPFTSTLINWGRHTLGVVPPVWLFAGWMGAPGVLVGQALGGVVFAAVSVALVRQRLRTGLSDAAPDPLQRHARLFQLFQHRR